MFFCFFRFYLCYKGTGRVVNNDNGSRRCKMHLLDQRYVFFLNLFCVLQVLYEKLQQTTITTTFNYYHHHHKDHHEDWRPPSSPPWSPSQVDTNNQEKDEDDGDSDDEVLSPWYVFCFFSFLYYTNNYLDYTTWTQATMTTTINGTTTITIWDKMGGLKTQ